MRRIGRIGRKWIAFRKEWLKSNPPPYTCGICKKAIPEGEVVLDHIIARSRRPDLRFDPKNIQPAHWICNSEKGSTSVV